MDRGLDVALRLSKVAFRWATLLDESSIDNEGKDSVESDYDREGANRKDEGFSLRNLDLAIPRGRLVALVGRVGSGKSSLLQGVSGLASVLLTLPDYR